MMKKTNDTPLTIRTMFEVVYSESIPNNDIEELIRLLNPCEYAYILHDKDLEPSGEIKKPHYHIWCRWETPQRHDTILKFIGLNERHRINTARSQKACLLYMLHKTKESKKLNKYIYDIENITSNICDERLNELLTSSDDIKGNEISRIFEIIDDIAKLVNYEYRYSTLYEELIIRLVCEGLLDTYNYYYNSVFKYVIHKKMS